MLVWVLLETEGVEVGWGSAVDVESLVVETASSEMLKTLIS